MSLLSVTVKKARYVSIPATQFNTYVTLKLQNVKSTTVTVKGPTPCWEQDFLFEINDINLGLLVEVWHKGVIFDRALGYHLLPLTSVAYNEECGARWIELESQLRWHCGAVVGTTGSTGHALLLDCRFEQPFDAEGTGGADLQRKLDMLNGALDAERAEQARRQMQYIANSGYSEDSDYTSDLNYPVGQHPNCSASQYRSAAHQMHTPQGSLEVSRENSYEREEYHLHGDAEPLYYNSQPRGNRIETWSQYQPELHAQASVESAISWRTATDWQSGEDHRRPSLERQNTLYDDMSYGYDYNMSLRDHKQLSQQTSFDEYYDSSSHPYQVTYGGDDCRQWDSGGQYFYDDAPGYNPMEHEMAIHKRRSSIVQLPQVPARQLPASSRFSDSNGMAPYRPRQRRTAASLPATPSSTPKRVRVLPVPPCAGSLTGRTGRGRRLPILPYPVSSVISQSCVPYVTEPKKILPPTSFGYDTYSYQPEHQDSANDLNYNTSSSYDEQPFFNETPHATPPAYAQKMWTEDESQFSYPTTDDERVTTRTLPTNVSTYLPQPPTSSYQDQQFTDYQYQTTQEEQYIVDQNQCSQQQDFQQEEKYQPPYRETQPLYQPPHLQKQQKPQQQQQFQQNQEKLPAQQLQATVMTGAATLGSFMAGGAKKLGSLFGAAAAAVAPPVQPPSSVPRSTSTINSFSAPAAPVTSYTAAVAPVTPFTSTSTTILSDASVPEVSPSVPVSAITTSAPIALPRTPSLRRQESIQRPPVRRIRTLPDAPEDFPPSGYDESAYDDEYHKTEYEETLENDRTSLNRYDEDEYSHQAIQEEVIDNTRHLSEDHSVSLQKTASPTRNGVQLRKPSVDSYHAAPAVDRRTSQGSFQQGSIHEEPIVPTTQEETVTEKSKVTFQEEPTTYDDVPEEGDNYQDETYDEDQHNYTEENFREHDDQFQKDNDQFDEQDDQYNEAEEAYREDDNVFQEEVQVKQPSKFKEAQPKLTPKQRWHRAYNKIIIQLNIRTRLGTFIGNISKHGFEYGTQQIINTKATLF